MGLHRFAAEADRRPPHLAIDSLLTVAERMEREQGGRLAKFQARTFAAFLLGAERLPPDAADPDIAPKDSGGFDCSATHNAKARPSGATYDRRAGLPTGYNTPVPTGRLRWLAYDFEQIVW
jgi:hypothetical protein